MSAETFSETRPGTPEPATDGERLRELFRDLAGGDREALGEIYDRTARSVYGLALWRLGRDEEAADVVQDVFVRLVERRSRLARVRRPLPYLLTMTHRLVIDRRRRKGRLVEAETLLLAAEASAPDAAGRVDANRASRLLSTLPAAQREALYLRYFCELTLAEVGRVAGVSLFTAASRCRLGLRRLRALLGEAPGGPA
jgi:RNA polymerase sigma-70 factor (ECF subfamily)